MTNPRTPRINLQLVFERHVSVTLPKEGASPAQTLLRSPTAVELQEIKSSLTLAARELGGDYQGSSLNERSQRVFALSVDVLKERKMRAYAKRVSKSLINSTTKTEVRWPKLVDVRVAPTPFG